MGEIHPVTPDAAKVEAFADRLLGVLNDAGLSLMVSLGHRAGLFDTMAELPPSTSDEIAKSAGLDERYVREWLGAMVTSRVVVHDRATGHYALPAEHAAFMTRAAGSDNMAVFAQYIAELGSVESDILECFKSGGGVPYERFERFHEIMAEDSGQSVLPALLDQILPLIPGLAEKLGAGIRVLDAGCGRGKALHLLAHSFPRSEFVGYDLSEEAVAWARQEAERQELANTRFEVRDLSRFDVEAEPEAFDLVTTFDAVHDQARPKALLGGIARTLRPDGVYLMQDIHASCEHHNNIEHPMGTLLYTISTMHCMTVSLAQGGEGLGAMWGREVAEKYLESAGFRQIEVKRLDHDPQNDYYIVRK
jgi:SAM-dependent methyltransferase